MKQPKFEVYQNAAGEWAWRLIAANGETQASGEGYRSKRGALAGVEACRRNAARAAVKVLD